MDPVEAMHQAIASRSFGYVGPIARPIQGVHDTIAAGVYASIRAGAFALGAAIDRSSAPVPSEAGNGVVSFVNAVWGDDLGRHEGRLSTEMTIRTASGAQAAHAVAQDGVTGHLVVLVHGLGQTEDSWRSNDAPDLVDHIGADHRLTPLLVRYNTGRSVPTNGRDLAATLESAVAAWPVDVTRVTIIGHSLGGLVARSACLVGQEEDHTWSRFVTDVITTGTPHTGAPAEKVANAAAWGLSFAKVTRPLAAFVNRRSRGIKDLRFGAIRDSDWGGNHPDALLRNTAAAHPFPSHIAHHAIATTVTDAIDGAPAWLLGDGMVRTSSATSLRGGKPDTATVKGGVAHFSIQRHPAVAATVMDIVGTPAPG